MIVVFSVAALYPQDSVELLNLTYQSLSLLDSETVQSIVVRTEFFGVQLESVRRLIIAVYMQRLKVQFL